MAEEVSQKNFKLLLIGNSSVGKSSLLLRFTDDDFLSEEETTATIGVDFRSKSVEVGGKRYKLSIWDTAGQERFRTLTSSYYRGAQAVILVYDVSSRSTFDELLKWFKEIDTYCGEGVVKVVVGNKMDKEFSRQVSTEEGRAFAERMGTSFVECSAKTRTGVLDIFQEVVRKILASPELYASAPRRHKPDAIRVTDQTAEAADGGWGSACSC
ncbi:putative ras-related protein rab-18 [Papiliotrema laurentii]|uniref:Ras-related protein rab-18 n=1 Tax=Papiliotrema laurentii TaxID=5418 RepID=A0AAD9L8N3_PAPLA|nr:putative ras-related protein rab-18 [Papiliotrema laurentii]